LKLFALSGFSAVHLAMAGKTGMDAVLIKTQAIQAASSTAILSFMAVVVGWHMFIEPIPVL
jgi:hypothetical protein